MSKRSISDKEIALIKSMLGRGMKNKDIQFFFNRPDRPVNSGRISGIGDGTYSNSKNIAAATEGELEEFIKAHTPNPDVAEALVSPAPDEDECGPLAIATLMKLFGKGDDDVWRLRDGETDEHECKSNFGFKHAHKWLRAIAALANNRGGYVFLELMTRARRDLMAKITAIGSAGSEMKSLQRPIPPTSPRKLNQFSTRHPELGPALWCWRRHKLASYSLNSIQADL